MTAMDLLDRTDALLEQERAAILAMSAEEVLRIASEKEAIFAELGSLVGRSDLAERVARVAVAARRNCLLLAHARDCTREAVGAIARELNTSIAPPGLGPATTTGRRGLKLSVTG